MPNNTTKDDKLSAPAYYADILSLLTSNIRKSQNRPVWMGISGPQGGGKSTLAAYLVAQSPARGIAISVDDFYLTYSEQTALANLYPGNRTLEFRGYPGTHDVPLGKDTLLALNASIGQAEIPQYDKSAHNGRGDRAPLGKSIQLPVDFVILEGWMLGFSPVVAPPALLAATNDLLANYHVWDELLDVKVALVAESLTHIVDWRMDSEAKRRQVGETTLSEAQTRDYIERFLPAYETYSPQLRGWADLRIELKADRSGVICR